jgi:hypothetical protein
MSGVKLPSMNFEIAITDITPANKQAKLVKLARVLSDQMGLGADIAGMGKAKTHKFINKKWVNDHWEYEYPQDNTARRVNHASQVELITGIAPLNVNPGNVYQAIKNYEQVFKRAVKNGIKCKWIQNRKVAGFVGSHLTKKQGNNRPLSEIIERAALLPFVLPIIQKYGHVSHVEKNQNGGYDYELVGKAEIKGRKYAITVIMSDSQKRPKNLVCVSLFGFTKNVIKSLATAGGLDQEGFGFPVASIGKWTSSLNHILIIPQISAKSTGNYPSIELFIKDVTDRNRKEKFAKAIRETAKFLDVPVSVEKKHEREPYLYDVQQELSDQWTGYYEQIIRKIYKMVTEAMSLPSVEVETIRKAMGDSGRLRYHGKVIYNPETGRPLKVKEFNSLIEAIEKFLNRNTTDTAKRLVLDSVAIGKLLGRMAKYQSSPDMKRLKLNTMKYRGKTFDWIRKDIKNLTNVMGKPLSGPEMARYQVAQDYVSHLVTRSNQKIREEIRETVLRGIVDKRTKGQVSQDLFNRLGALNRDWKRIADTEIVNTSNLAGILQEVNEAPNGEKVYFKRYELPGCCKICAKADGVIALWSNTPLADDKIKDPYTSIALWEGKSQEKGKTVLVTGILHPNCYDKDTEVMTDHGWKLFKDLLDDDKIMSLNPETQEIDFVCFVKRVSYQYDGTMIHFKGRNYDLSVTPDHNMLFVSQKGFYREASAEELFNKRNYSLPRAIGKWEKDDPQGAVDFGDLKISKKQYFRLWAWYLAEGSGRTRDKNSHEVKLAQKYPENIIADLHDLKTVLHKNPDSVSLYGKWAEPFKEMFGIHADKKYIPEFIKESSAENIREFLEAFSLADGTKRVRSAHARSYSERKKEQIVRTSSKKMADDLCELIVKAGWIPSININHQKGNILHFRNGDYIVNTDCYNINICKSKFRGVGMRNIPGHPDRHEPYEEEYHGMVYDVELEKWHFLLVKRNGKCAWSGNCRGGWLRWGGKQVDAMTAQVRGKAEKWDAAVKQAREEYQKRGTENPNDQTPGYVDRINEVYREKLGEE